jgi:hypothetical protein
VVVLERADWLARLDLTKPEPELEVPGEADFIADADRASGKPGYGCAEQC